MSRNSSFWWWGSHFVICLAVLGTGVAAHAVDATMNREHFLGRLKIELRKNLCEEGGFTDCFAVSKSQCEDFVTGQFDRCSDKVKTGARVSLVGEDLVVAETVSTCLSDRFSKKFKNKLKESNECKIRKNH